MSPTSGSGVVPYIDLTQYEIRALESRYNLADAHAHQLPSPLESDVIDALPRVWEAAQRISQGRADEEFLRTFFGFHGQPTMARDTGRCLLSYAASVAMTVVATHLRLRRARVSLIEPCFDNLYEILAQNELRIDPVPESVLFRADDVYAALARQDIGDALILVDPNNPTGETTFTDGGHRFEQIVRFCADTGRTLVLDFSFTSFLHRGGRPGRPDVYEILDRSGVTYLTIEDTGKTWPTIDIKCGILTTSGDIREEIRNIHTGVMLNVSPFALRLLTHFIEASAADGFGSVSGLLATNRRAVMEAVRGTHLEYLPPVASVSVAWLRLRDGRATELQESLARDGVHVLPGTHFYWSDHERGESYVRIALARDPDGFARSVSALRAALLAR